jgi:hypothetical protein
MISNIFLIIFLSLLFSMIIESPLIYARIKDKNFWTPINSPPWMIGDDYYFYSILNEFHKKFLSLRFKTLKTTVLSNQSIYQFFGYILNLIPYHLGYIFEDKRLGVLFVKLCNRMFLILSVVFFSTQILNILGHAVLIEKLILILLLYFLLFPGPISWSFIRSRRSIFFNIFNSKDIFHYAHANDLTRGQSETTSSLLILFLGITFNMYLNSPEYMIVYVSFFLFVLFFQYFPSFVVYSFTTIALLTFTKYYGLAIFFIVLSCCLSLFYIKVISNHSGVASELYSNNNRKIIFNKRIGLFLEIISVLVLAFLLAIYINNYFLAILLISSSLFVLTHLFSIQPLNLLNRFWQRGASYIFQLLIIIITVEFLAKFSEKILYFAIFLILTMFLIYFFNNSKYLYKIGSTKVPKKINQNTISKIFDPNCYGVSYVSSSVEISYYINLYTNNNAVLKNFIIQKHGYREHLKDICYNFKAIGYDLAKVTKLLTSKSLDWRSLKARENIDENYSYFHELQFIACNYLYNQKIIKEGMYVNYIWTKKYKDLIENIWYSINSDNFDDVEIINES